MVKKSNEYGEIKLLFDRFELYINLNLEMMYVYKILEAESYQRYCFNLDRIYIIEIDNEKTINTFKDRDVQKHFSHSLLFMWTDFYLEGG